jgi:hypothetical protein
MDAAERSLTRAMNLMACGCVGCHVVDASTPWVIGWCSTAARAPRGEGSGGVEATDAAGAGAGAPAGSATGGGGLVSVGISSSSSGSSGSSGSDSDGDGDAAQRPAVEDAAAAWRNDQVSLAYDEESKVSGLV